MDTNNATLKVGQKVRHDLFGEGRIFKISEKRQTYYVRFNIAIQIDWSDKQLSAI